MNSLCRPQQRQAVTTIDLHRRRCPELKGDGQTVHQVQSSKIKSGKFRDAAMQTFDGRRIKRSSCGIEIVVPAEGLF